MLNLFSFKITDISERTIQKIGELGLKKIIKNYIKDAINKFLRGDIYNV